VERVGGSKVQTSVRALFVLVCLILVLAGFPKPVEALAETKLFGRVIDINGLPVSDCYIDASDKNYASLGSTYTSDNGYYELSVPGQKTYHVWAGKTDRYNFLYIPQSRVTTSGQNDFKLMPGANIIINAYDAQGDLMRNQSFRQATLSRVFATDLTDVPAYSYFGAIHDEKSNWDWNQAIPAFVVLPQKQYKLHVNLEVPGFGRVMLSADNEGNGYSLSRQGEQITINLNYEVAKSALSMLRKQSDASVAKEVETSAQHLAVAEGYLKQNPADMKNAVGELNLSLQYSLVAREQLVLTRAKSDIEKYRKGDIQLRIVDAVGNPLSNYPVSFSQVSNDFLFGANPMGGNGSYNAKIADLMKDAGVNHSYITARWGLIESQPGKFNWDNIDNYQRIDEQLSRGFKLMGALSLWLSPNNDFSPAYLKDMCFKDLKSNVYNHTYTLVSRYKGEIDTWEINEMNLASANALNLTQEQKLDIMKVFETAVRGANPQAKILNGSTALPYEFTDSVPFPALLNSGVPADIIGLELCYAGVNAEGYSAVGLDMAAVSDLLDFYSTFGKPIYIKELSAPSAQVSGSSWLRKPWDMETQAEYLEKLYTIAFSKPSVQAITWSWGISDQDAFIMSGGLLDASSNPKPAYFALKNLLHSWTTSGSGVTNSSGEYNFRGFGGEYNVTVEDSDGNSFIATIHVTEQQTNSFIISDSNVKYE
jgi:GH35 family endo-1,4-beta-xylanase